MVDITGKEYGRLVAIRPVEVIGTNWWWECYCDPRLGGCGATVRKPTTWLQRRSTKSCGCLRRDHARACNERARRKDHGEIIRLRRMGFTYAALGRMFKLSSGRCCQIIMAYAPHLRGVIHAQ